MDNERMRQRTENLQSTAEKKLQTAKAKTSELQRAARDRVTHFGKITDQYVHENPWGAIAMTAVYAFAIGIFVAVRRT